jgi:hypothetical protein
MEHVANSLRTLLSELRDNRDSEISMASEVLAQYVTDHRDRDAYRDNDRQVARLARAWDRMIALLERTVDKAERIEGGCENFYGN